MSATGVKHCPFCGSDRIEFDEIIHVWICQICLTEGPADDDDKATLWNKRSDAGTVEDLEAMLDQADAAFEAIRKIAECGGLSADALKAIQGTIK